MSSFNAAFGKLLREQDELRVSMEALSVPADGESNSNSGDLAHDKRRRLAVVSHNDPVNGIEAGSILVLRSKMTADGFEDYELERFFPIIGSFTVTTAQARRNTPDVRPGAQASVSQARSGFQIMIQPDEVVDGKGSVTLLTYDTQTLRDLLAECKRLKELSADLKVNTVSPTQTFSWLAPYTRIGHAEAIRYSSSPRDLRWLNTPLHERLSPASAGANGDDVKDLLVIQQDYVARKAREASVQQRQKLRIRIGTFNVNGKMPSQDLSTWIRGSSPAATYSDVPSELIPPLKEVSPLSLEGLLVNPFFEKAISSQNHQDPVGPRQPESFEKSYPHDADLIVAGFQELDLSTEALLYSTSTVREDAWTIAVIAALGEKGERYEKLASKQLVGMLLLIFVKKSLKDSFSDINTSAVGSGIMGIMGNKGGTAIRLTFTPPATKDAVHPGPTVLTFVNSHLAAFDEMVDRRNADYQDLCMRLGFDFPVNGGVAQAPGSLPQVDRFGIFETDALFWMGDLNYRIDLPDSEVRGILSSEHWANKFDVMARYDQLKYSMRTQQAFDGFNEFPIAHYPSYRFGSFPRDDLGYDLKRRPAWTDRILHMASPLNVGVQQTSYSSNPEIKQSDHRPVSADFNLYIDIYDYKRLKKEGNKLYCQLSGIETATEAPQIKIYDPFIDLGKVRYAKKITRQFKVENAGKSGCAFRFLALNSDEPLCPPWLKVAPLACLLAPGETITVTIAADVDKVTAAGLNLRPPALSHTLILHTMRGRDNFISVTGEYEYTCVGNSLGRLTRLPGPVRELKSFDDLLPESRAINAPRELMRLVNWLMTAPDSMDDPFFGVQDRDLVDTIFECLDSNKDFPFAQEKSSPETVNAFGTALLELLDSLTEPILPHDTQLRCAEATSRDEAYELLDGLPPASVNVWISVTAFLHFVASSSSEPSTKSQELAATFADILLKDMTDINGLPTVRPLAKMQFILYFIL